MAFSITLNVILVLVVLWHRLALWTADRAYNSLGRALMALCVRTRQVSPIFLDYLSDEMREEVQRQIRLDELNPR